MAIRVTVDETKGKIFIVADIETPVPSSTGRRLVVASTGYNLKTDQMIAGRSLTIGLIASLPTD